MPWTNGTYAELFFMSSEQNRPPVLKCNATLAAYNFLFAIVTDKFESIFS